MRKLRNDTPAREMTAREMIAMKVFEAFVGDATLCNTFEESASIACNAADAMIDALNKSAGVK